MPGNHDLPGRVQVRRRRRPRRSRAASSHARATTRRRRGRGSPPSRPRRPAPLPACSARGGAPCAGHPRRITYRPRRAPSTRRGCGRRRTPARCPCDSTSRHAATLIARIAGCVFSVSSRRSSGPVEAQRAQRLAERRVRFVERLAADRKRVGQRLAHADFLRALSGKDEGDHRIVDPSATLTRRSRARACSINPSADEPRTPSRRRCAPPWPTSGRGRRRTGR